MALIKCKECGKEISENAMVCPHCGFKADGKNLKTNKNIIRIILFIAIILIVLISYFILKQDNDYSVSDTDSEYNNEYTNEDIQENVNELTFDKYAINEIKTNISMYEVDYKSDKSKTREYVNNVVNEISKINKDNYVIYFETKEDYSKFIEDTLTNIASEIWQMWEDILAQKIDVYVGTIRMKELVDELNNKGVSYVRNNAEILLAESYTESRALQYDDLQAKINEGLSAFDNLKEGNNINIVDTTLKTVGVLLETLGEDLDNY